MIFDDMVEQKFGHKELYEVVLRAKTPMQFGERFVESQEPILYFDSIQIATLTEQNRPVMARGGFGNMPRVIWDDRSEVQFSMTDGVMSSLGMSILLSANVVTKDKNEFLKIHTKEGPLVTSGSVTINDQDFPLIELSKTPISYPEKKIFIFEYGRKAVQKKIYGKWITEEDKYNRIHNKIALSLDKNFDSPAKTDREYIVDYYYKYEDEALIYSVKKDRFNGLFTLEAKFYSKDENEGKNYTNVLFMPKVRIVSNIGLRLGERADPTVSTFNIIGMPETVGNDRDLIMEIIRLNRDIELEI